MREAKSVQAGIQSLGWVSAACSSRMEECCGALDTALRGPYTAKTLATQILASKQKEPESDPSVGETMEMLRNELARLERERIGMVIALGEKKKEINAARTRELEEVIAGLVPG